MIEIIREKKDIEEYFNVLKKRGAVNSGDFSNAVKDIVANVAKNGDKALEELSELEVIEKSLFGIKKLQANLKEFIFSLQEDKNSGLLKDYIVEKYNLPL